MSEWRRERPTLPELCYVEPKGVKLDFPGWNWSWEDKDVLLKRNNHKKTKTATSKKGRN